MSQTRLKKHMLPVLFCIIPSLVQAQESKTVSLRLDQRFGGLNVPETQIMNAPIDFAVGEDGRVYVLDSRDHNVKVFGSDGTFVKCFGRKGGGPGEMNRPWILNFIKAQLLIVDAGNQRIQIFSPDGEYRDSYKVPAQFGTGAALGPGGRLYLNSRGFRSQKSLTEYDGQGNILREFGDLEGEPYNFFDFTQIKKDIKSGKIPNSFKDDLLIAVAPDGTVWTVYRSLPLAKLYSPEGDLLRSWAIDCPDYKAIRRSYEEKNREAENQPNLFSPLRYVNDLALDSMGRLYVLLNTEEKMKVLVYGKDGSLIRSCLGPEDSVSRLAFDGRDRLYALSLRSHYVYVFGPDPD